MPAKTFGEYIREKRIAAGLSLREVADHIGCSHVHLGEVERGRKRALSKEHWDALIEIVPEIDREELRRLRASTEPVRPARLTEEGQELVYTLARRLERHDLNDEEMRKLRRLLGLEGKDDE